MWQGVWVAVVMLLYFGGSAFSAIRNQPATPIYEVIRDDDGDFVPDMLGKVVTIKGVLTSRPVTNDQIVIAHVQDDTAGLVLLSADIHAFDQVRLGDTVSVRGKISQSRGMEQLIVQKIETVSSGEVPPAREVRTTDIIGERFSGQLVRITGEIIGTGTSNNASFVVRDSRGDVPIFVSGDLLTWNNGELAFRLWKGGSATVTGIAGQEKASPPYNSGYGLIPRGPEDFKFAPPPVPPPSKAPFYIVAGVALILAIIALYLADRRRAADERTREVSRLLREIERSENEVKKQAAFAQFNPNPVLEFFADGTMTYFNDAARELASGLGKDAVGQILPEDVQNIVKECIATERARLKCDITIAGRTITWSFFPIHELTSVHAYGYDITEQQNLEGQLRQAQKLESIGQLAAGIAHDFNNLLSVIQGYASLTQMRSDLPPKVAEPLAEISAAAERASNLTRQLLTFSRRQNVEPRHLNLNDVVTNLARMLRRLIGEDIRLQLNSCAGEAWVYADPCMLEQIIVNLAVNARDAMPDGGDLVLSVTRIELDEAAALQHFDAKPGEFVRLSVSDTGCGMEGATLKRIFEPFFTTKEPGKGTGLGLATVHGIVKQHKGWIEVTSSVGLGSEFQVFLPCSAAPNAEVDGKLIRLPVAGGTETILVVEDDAALRKLARGVLEEYGYGVIDASCAREALVAWKEHRETIRLLFTDVVLPDGMSGWKLAEQLRAECPDLKVIFSTGFDLQGVNRRFAAVPDAILLRKPYPVQSIVRTIRECLDSVPAVQALNTSQIG